MAPTAQPHPDENSPRRTPGTPGTCCAKDTTVAKTDTWSLASSSLSRLTTQVTTQSQTVSEHSSLSPAFGRCTRRSSLQHPPRAPAHSSRCSFYPRLHRRPACGTISPSSARQARRVYRAALTLTAGPACLRVFVRARLQGLSELLGRYEFFLSILYLSA